MTTQILDGRAAAEKLLSSVKSRIVQNGLHPKLLIIQVGDRPASTQYVALKKKKGEEIGVEVIVKKLGELSGAQLHDEVTQIISEYKEKVNGIMIQLPLPNPADTEEILSLIPMKLDVDGLRLFSNGFPTAVASAVSQLLTLAEVDRLHDNLIIVGLGKYVGQSIYSLLQLEDYANLETADETTRNIGDELYKADVVISCVGRPHVFFEEDLRPGAVLIDVGTSKDEKGKIVGDFDTSRADGYLKAYTPVPGGVGPMTVASLLEHVVDATEKSPTR